MIMINSLPRAGRMFFTAWGTTTNHMALLSLKPRLSAASFCPGSTAWMPERMTSDTDVYKRQDCYAREKLAAYLWPDSAASAAKYNLRYTLWQIKKLSLIHI